MNPLAIELYRMHGNDIERDPLPFNVSNQQNGVAGMVENGPAWLLVKLPVLTAPAAQAECRSSAACR